MAGFGEELRAERMRQGMSLETMSVSTKVNPRHFDAIEREDLLALPGGVFRKGIVRAYLTALGLEEEPWLTRYQAAWDGIAQSANLGSEDAQRTQQDAWATFAANVQRGRSTRRQSGSWRWLGVLALFLALAASAWLLWRAFAPGALHPPGTARVPRAALGGAGQACTIRVGPQLSPSQAGGCIPLPVRRQSWPVLYLSPSA